MLHRPFCPFLACRRTEAGRGRDLTTFAPFRDGARAAWRGTWALLGGLDADLGHQGEIGLALAVATLAGIGAAARPRALELLLAPGAGDLEAVRGTLHQRVGGWICSRRESGIKGALAAHRAEPAIEIAAAAFVDVGRATRETRHDVVARPVNAGRQ